MAAQPTYNAAHHFPDLADSAVEYEYDGNGNMTKDLKIPSKREQGELVRHAEREVFGMKFNRDITSIEYNSLNLRLKAVKIGCTSEKKEKSSLFSLLSTRFALSLPGQISFSDRTKMKFTYDAQGSKLRAEYWTVPSFNPGGPVGPASLGGGAEPQGGGIVGPILPPINQNDPQVVTDYCGDLIYRNDTLTMLLTEEGYVTFDERGEPLYHYYLKDHLGSVRVVLDGDGTVEQVNDYYPSGTLMYTSTNGTVQPYKFGRKELERTLPLDEYDFGARWMDPTVGARFTTMDPLCEKYYSVSPYAYCGGNPVNAVDPDGRYIISKEQAKKYPRLNLYLQKGIQGILKNPTIMKALRIAGRFTDKQIKEMVTYGKGPTINVTSMEDDTYGFFTPGINSTTLNISESIVNDLEKAKGFDSDIKLFFLAVTILHESAHYGDDLAGNVEGEDREDGEVFEINAYGQVIYKSNVKDYLLKFSEAKNNKKKEKEYDEKNKK